MGSRAGVPKVQASFDEKPNKAEGLRGLNRRKEEAKKQKIDEKAGLCVGARRSEADGT